MNREKKDVNKYILWIFFLITTALIISSCSVESVPEFNVGDSVYINTCERVCYEEGTIIEELDNSYYVQVGDVIYEKSPYLIYEDLPVN